MGRGEGKGIERCIPLTPLIGGTGGLMGSITVEKTRIKEAGHPPRAS